MVSYGAMHILMLKQLMLSVERFVYRKVDLGNFLGIQLLNGCAARDGWARQFIKVGTMHAIWRCSLRRLPSLTWTAPLWRRPSLDLSAAV